MTTFGINDDEIPVALVLDRNIGARLLDIVSRVPVWLIGSPSNRDLARAIWQDEPKANLTIFESDQVKPVDCLSAIGTIDVHAHEYNDEFLYDTLLVIGLDTNEGVENELAAFNFTDFRRTETGLVARRARVAHPSA
jgi:hypothetical protein